MKEFREMALTESEKLKNFKAILKEVKDVIKAVEKEAVLSDKKSTSEADKLKSSYSMMKQLKEINPIIAEADDFINMNW